MRKHYSSWGRSQTLTWQVWHQMQVTQHHQ
uniref:Uncharacterized protein n=1 Tax=Arundo donax TaxID=35708 RepID=A0A0A8ZHB6_ARUDO